MFDQCWLRYPVHEAELLTSSPCQALGAVLYRPVCVMSQQNLGPIVTADSDNLRHTSGPLMNNHVMVDIQIGALATTWFFVEHKHSTAT